ncbi:MAG: hypothetical protein WCR55_12495 [Lentisphaerota bacterium]
MNKDKLKDTGYAIVKATLGSIPLAGAAASELLSLLVASPLERRREKWMSEIGERLLELERAGKINLEALKENPVFIDTVLAATQIALKTSEQEKLYALKNALINTALSESPDQSEIQIFISLIDIYTIWHIRLLKLFDDPIKWFKDKSLAKPNYMSAGLKNIIDIAFPELQDKNEFCNIIWDDLHRAGFHKSGSLHVMMTNNGLMASRTTEYGKNFLKYISE